MKKKKTRAKLRWKSYVNSDSWLKKKLWYFKTHRKRCRACDDFNKIHLHHVSYKNLGREREEDLMPLCDECHTELHSLYGTADLLNNSYKFIMEKQVEVANAEMMRHVE